MPERPLPEKTPQIILDLYETDQKYKFSGLTLKEKLSEFYKERISQKYHTGFVVGMIVDQKSPDKTLVYFDAGRRLQEGIVLEGIRIPTTDVLSRGISLNDLVQANRAFNQLEKLATTEDLEKQGILVQRLPFEWEHVIGVRY